VKRRARSMRWRENGFTSRRCSFFLHSLRGVIVRSSATTHKKRRDRKTWRATSLSHPETDRNLTNPCPGSLPRFKQGRGDDWIPDNSCVHEGTEVFYAPHAGWRPGLVAYTFRFLLWPQGECSRQLDATHKHLRP